MANVKISDLGAASTPLTGAEEVPIVQSGTTVKATVSDISGSITLQQVIDNNHDLNLGNNYQGTGAGASNAGSNLNAFGSNAGSNNGGNDINAFGEYAASQNTGLYVNAIGSDAASGNSGTNVNAIGLSAGKLNTKDNLNAVGDSAGFNNTGDNVNAFGSQAGNLNTYSDVNLFGKSASADNNNQTVFSQNDGAAMARLDYDSITADRKYTLPDETGTLALLSDIPGGGGSIINIQRTITSAEIQTLQASPIVLATASAGKILAPVSLFYKYNFGTTAYLASSIYLFVSYSGGLGTNALTGANSILSSVTSAQSLVTSFTTVTVAQDFDGCSLTISSLGSNILGDGTLDVYLSYQEITL